MRIGIGSFSPAAPEGEAALLAGVPATGRGEGRAGRELLVPALVDALLGAAALGDFRALDAAERAGGEGADAPGALARATRAVERENYQVVNVDVSLRGLPEPAGDLPTRVAERIAAGLHAAPSAVSVKWSAEPGHGAGPPTALAVVLLDQIADIDALHASLRGG